MNVDHHPIHPTLDTNNQWPDEEVLHRYRLIAMDANDAILFAQADGRITDANQAAVRIYGYEKRELVGMNLTGLQANQAAHEHAFSDGKAELPGTLFETWHRRKDGGCFPAEVSLTRGSTDPQQVMLVARDITERKMIERAAIHKEKLAVLDRLADGLAEALHGPITDILNRSEQLLNDYGEAPLGQEQLVESLLKIQRCGWQCNEIARALKTYVTGCCGRKQPEDLNEILRDTLILVEHHLTARPQIHMVVEYAPGLPAVYCDATQIKQAILNLIVNARDAVFEGGAILVRTGYAEPEKRVLLDVQDSGCGIPLELQSRVFDPFFSTKPDGMGLGLSTTLGIIQEHRGEITLDSQPHQGTLFRIHLRPSLA
ncbi:MAG: PAS domain S-box protein [Anaerolineaceae bacterium]|nr:PAS domain S-box protein [Anaerolineaceae bacterium]